MIKRTMFDNYDNPNKKPQIDQIFNFHDRQLGSYNVELITDLKGREIGIRAKEGSTFMIYFTFSGDDDLPTILSTMIFGCEIYDKRNQLVARPSVTVYTNDLYASITLTSEKDGVLEYGNYYIYLYMTDEDDVIYPLFTKDDAILSIE